MSGCPDPCIAGGSHPIILLSNIPYPATVSCNQLFGTVIGAVVYDQQFKIAEGLIKDRIYGQGQEMLTIIGRDYDTDRVSGLAGLGIHQSR
jgi:hypothetical protein